VIETVISFSRAGAKPLLPGFLARGMEIHSTPFMPWDTATLIQVLCNNIMYAWLLVEREDAVLSWDSPKLSPMHIASSLW